MMPEPRPEQQRIDLEIQAFGRPIVPNVEQLSEAEEWWKQRYEWFNLKDRGYLLRGRYSPDWIPSWIGTQKYFWHFEDGNSAKFPAQLLDANVFPMGLMLFSNGENHCVPIYEVFQVPGDEEIDLMVMPLLSEYTYLPFDTIGKIVECFRQLFEGLLFIHKCRVAHRDCTSRNVMLDPNAVFIDPFHPADRRMKRDFSGRARFKTRTEGRPRYYLIDFGLSRRYDPSVAESREPPIWGADRTVPEFRNSYGPCDPFPTDVYYIGNMIRNDFLELARGLDFMRPLVADMVQDDPSKRLTMQEVVDRFEDIRAGLSTWKVRSRIVDAEENLVERITRGISHWIRRIGFIAKGIPALPTPSS